MKFHWIIAVALAMGANLFAADAPPGIVVDTANKSITVPAKIAPRKLAKLDQIYPVEVIACWPESKNGQKAHETVVVFDIKPSEVHKALESFGLKAGKPAQGEGEKAEGPEVMVSLELPDGKKVPIEKTLLDKKTGKPMPRLKWLFTGSVMSQPNPEKDEKVYGADMTGTLVGIFPVTNQVVIQTNRTIKDEPLLTLETDKKLLPPEGTPVKLIIEAKK